MIFVILLLAFNLSLYSASGEFYFSEKNSSSIEKKIRTFAQTNKHTIELKKENAIEVYFDTPELTLSTQNAFIKYQIKSLQHPQESEASAPNKKRKKNYQESVLYLTQEQTLLEYPVKHYHTIKSSQEKHPLLSLIKRANREDFFKKVKENGIKYPLKLKYIFKLSRATDIYTLTDSTNPTNPQITILVNKINFESFDTQKNFTTIETTTPIKQLTKEPNATKIRNNPYVFYLNQIKKENFHFTKRVKYPHIFHLLNSVIISLFLVFLFYIFSTLFFINFYKKTR